MARAVPDLVHTPDDELVGVAPTVCVLCGCSEFFGVAGYPAEPTFAHLSQCVNCLMSMHTGCMNSAYHDLTTYSIDRTAPPAGFPDEFMGALCRLCDFKWSL